MMAQVQQRLKATRSQPTPIPQNKQPLTAPKTAPQKSTITQTNIKIKTLTAKIQRLQAGVLLQRSRQRSSSRSAHGVV